MVVGSALILIVAALLDSATAKTRMNDVYIAENASGSASGTDCADAYAVKFFNASGNWGTGAGQIGPGTVVHLCGTITSGLDFSGSGTSGNVIEILWESGAKLIQLAGGLVYIGAHS